MQDRNISEKNALIIFNPQFENAARAFVQENLQYRTQYTNIYMLPVPSNGKGASIDPAKELMQLLAQEGITRLNTDSYLIRKKAATQWGEPGDECYSKSVLDFAKNFKKHFVMLTYDYFLGEEKFSSLTRFRQHKKYTSSQGYPQAAVTQVALLKHMKKKWKTTYMDGSFFSKELTYATPPYKYLLLPGMHSRVKKPPEFTEEERAAYHQEIEKQITLRQQKVDPILRKAEQDFRDPETVAEKLANLFHLYATDSRVTSVRSHREIARIISKLLYANPDWELEECLHVIKSETDHSRKIVNPRGTFQGLLLAILNMMHDQSIMQVGVQLKDCWQEKYKELEELKEGMDGDAKICVNTILQELKKAEENRKPYAVLLRAAESTIDIIQHPSTESYRKQSQVAREIGKHSWGRVLAGSLLCLLDLSLGIGIGLAVYFSGGAALLLGAPLVVYGVMLSAALVNAGAAVVVGAAAASLPLIGSGLCLFAKPPVQKSMEHLAKQQRQQI